MEGNTKGRLRDTSVEIGFGAVTREDDAYLMPDGAARRHRVPSQFTKQMVEGEDV